MRRRSPERKSKDDIIKMRAAGLMVADIHDALRAAVRPGVTTGEMDQVAADLLAERGYKSNFYGYFGFPGHICVSVNEEVVHGIPGDRVIEDGDLVSFDCGAVVDGWHGDACFSVVVGRKNPKAQQLIDHTEHSMWAGIAALADGKRVDAVGDAIEDYLETVAPAQRPGIVEEYVGHGIGTAMHQPPDVPNYRTRGRGAKVRPGMCLCIEPMLTAGSPEVRTLDDDWTVVTVDGSWAAHVEHMVAIHDKGIWVLSARDGGVAGLAPFGVEPVPLA